MKNIRIYSLAWLGLVILAILNGILRVAGYSAYMSELCAHQLSTAIGIHLFGIYFWIFSKIFPLESAKQAWIIGAIWLILTISFEFLFGHFIMDHSWGKLFADYNILKGRVWILVLLWTFIGPYFFYKIRN
jgi:hypothetical protein